MKQPQVFQSDQFGAVRVLYEDGKPLFCGADACRALGYQNPRKAVADHCKGVTKRYTLTNGGKQQMSFLPEGDLYRLICHSELPSAEQFERWVFDEVLPSIRGNGAYMTPETLQAALLNPDTMIQLCQQLKAEQEKNQILQAENSHLTVAKQIMQPKADYFDELVDRNLLTNFRETAKQLGAKPKAFIQFLLDKKYIYRDKRGHLMPYAQHVENGLFAIKEQVNEKTNWAGTQTLVTPKGRETFRLLVEGGLC